MTTPQVPHGKSTAVSFTFDVDAEAGWLGALHVGEATDVTTRYMEVREIDLPSGLWTFSTLQKVALGPGDFGPYEPAVAYPGSLAEDDKVKAWVAALPR